MVDIATHEMTLEEYFAWDPGDGVRYELVDGVPIAMAPTRDNHALVTANLIGALFKRLRPPCRAKTGAGLIAPDRRNTCYIPDVVVTCGERKAGDGLIYDDARLVAEVLSPTTERYNKHAKVESYRQIVGVTEILLLARNRAHVQRYWRDGTGWRVDDHVGLGELPLSGLGITLPLAELYDGVEL